MGGYSEEFEISIKSGNNIFQNIDTKLFNPYKVIIEKNNWYVKYNGTEYSIDETDFSFKIDKNKIEFDVVFNIIHGTPGEDGLIQKYFDGINMPYTGPNANNAKITFNKNECIDFAKNLGLSCAKSIFISNNQIFDFEFFNKMKFPLFVKTNNSGSSFGVTKVNDKDELKKNIENLLGSGNGILIEESLNGTEVSVGLMKYEDEIKVFGITEIITENDFFDYEAKYMGKSSEITPARIPNEISIIVKTSAKLIYENLKLSGFARIDFIIVDDIPYFLELNSIPGMSDESIFPKQVRLSNLKLKDLVSYMISNALNN
tara:strand:- start:46 stop:993 length:948 start_codon:yes stop_codon:yes gene_type:complete